MNINAIRTALSGVALVLATVMGFLPQALGCTVDAITNAVSCVGSWLPPAWVGTITAALVAANLILKVFQGGTINFGGWFKPSAVVSDSGKVGTVSPADVVKS